MKILSYVCVAALATVATSSAQSIEEKIGEQSSSNIRARVGNHPLDISHSIYTGTYGKTKGIFVLQWFHSTKVRGSFFDSSNKNEIRLYGDNSKPGKVIMEAWKQNIHNGSGLIAKVKGSAGQLAWMGTIHFTELLDYPVKMTKYTPTGQETLTSASTYHGKLGKASIRVKLNWYSNGRVRGRYTNLNNGKSYDLIGYNYANGKLYLDEWDSGLGDIQGGLISARVTLNKVTVNGRVQWQGRMFNMDKRNFAMSFARTGSTGATPKGDTDLDKKLGQ